MGRADQSTDEGTRRLHSVQGSDAAPPGGAQNPGARAEYSADRAGRIVSGQEFRNRGRLLYERLRAIASISIRAPRGSAATCTVARGFAIATTPESPAL